MSLKSYASLVGSLMYANICTRPDLAFIVGLLGRFQSNLDGYKESIKRTKSFMLVYGRENGLEVVSYTNSDVTGDLDERKSIVGYVFMFNGEFVACLEGIKQAVWLKNFISDVFSKNNKRTSTSRLVDVKFFKVRENVRQGAIIVEHLTTNLMIVDHLTKALLNGIFKTHVTRIGVLEAFEKKEKGCESAAMASSSSNMSAG
ncbi:hypothetical protein DVH24_018687 [Malus domestica]|uniref:Reverse transcriptase Ty1/copia-type domain-containing protein n=1 Tax=Malus domestica TaxID=3750 RepID=A0A498HN61_MALDO|nr:hypothetical protein DVH24_018687 [Malus domestica]